MASTNNLVLEHRRGARRSQGRGQPQPPPTMEFVNGAARVFSGQLSMSMCLCQAPQKVASPKHFDAVGPGLRLPPGFGAQMGRPKTTGSGPPPAPLAAHTGIRKWCCRGIFEATVQCACVRAHKGRQPKAFRRRRPWPPLTTWFWSTNGTPKNRRVGAAASPTRHPQWNSQTMRQGYFWGNCPMRLCQGT